MRDIWFESQGTRLFAREVGSGPTLVFLHGGLADHRAALQHVAPLAAACRLILPDLRGSGRSVYAGELTWDLLADDVVALLAHLGIPAAAVGGTSMGSGVALRCALRHPARTLGLLLVAPVYPGTDRGLTPAQLAAMRAMGKAAEAAREHGVEALVPLYAQLPEDMRERALAMLRSFDAASVAATARFLASTVQPFDSSAELAEIRAAALVVPGTDPEHPTEVAALYAQQLPHARLVDPATLELLASFCADL